MIAGDVENEDEILEWLLSQLEKDEIEDVTDEMLDRLIKDGKTLAVLFCKLLFGTDSKFIKFFARNIFKSFRRIFKLILNQKSIFSLCNCYQTTTMTGSPRKF